MEPYYNARLSRYLYIMITLLCLIGIVTYIIMKINNISILNIYPFKCYVYVNFGLYCPGCGITRAVDALLKGNLFESFRYHPAVLYSAFFTLVYIMSHTLNIITKGRVRAMMFAPFWFYIMIVIIILQCIVKNLCFILLGIRLI